MIRLLPERNEDNEEISVYYEFLDYDKKLFLDDLWFNRRGNFTLLARQTEEPPNLKNFFHYNTPDHSGRECMFMLCTVPV